MNRLNHSLRLYQRKMGKYNWTIQSLEKSTYDKVIEHAQDDLSQAEIAEFLSINKSSVSRHIKKAKDNGDLKNN